MGKKEGQEVDGVGGVRVDRPVRRLRRFDLNYGKGWDPCASMDEDPEFGEYVLYDELMGMLPDNFSESKDWKSGGPEERVEWLKLFNGVHRNEIERLETQLLEILEQLDDVRDRSERYREALVQILAGENDLQCAWWQIARSALERA